MGAHVHNGRYAAFVAPLLGHGCQKRSITERYIHQKPEALRPAADAIAARSAQALALAGRGKVDSITQRPRRPERNGPLPDPRPELEHSVQV